MSIAAQWCADPTGIAAMIEAGAPFMFKPKPGESDAEFLKTMQKYARKVAKSAAKKGTADKTREAIARQDAARELGAALERAASEVVPDADVTTNEAHAAAWAAWEASKRDPIMRVIEGIPPLVFLHVATKREETRGRVEGMFT
jgi:hypothetical protein